MDRLVFLVGIVYSRHLQAPVSRSKLMIHGSTLDAAACNVHLFIKLKRQDLKEKACGDV